MGVEIDLRSRRDEIILEHDPFVDGEVLADWLTGWSGQFLVLNIKEEGLEEKILEILDSFKISSFFFLDQSFPFLMKSIRAGDTRVAARASDIESTETVVSSGAGWCWLDCFTGDWQYLVNSVTYLTEMNIKTCLVSPELHRPESILELNQLQTLIRVNSLRIDAVCTKDSILWR